MVKKMDENGQKKTGQKRPNVVKNGQKWPKYPKAAQMTHDLWES